MKIIDLLNKIANGEKIEAIHKLFILKYYNLREFHITYDKSINDFTLGDLIRILNDEVEILEEEPRDINVCGSWFTKSEYDELVKGEEEKKIPEKLKWNEKSQHNIVTDNTKKTLEHLLSRSEQLKKSINQIIDYLECLKSKGE